MTTFPAVAIVSVTYNRCEPLLVLLAQLRTLDYPRERLHIYLVDNASEDDTVARVRQAFPEVDLTLSTENLGTSAGFNLGMGKALQAGPPAEYIWLLDSDAEVEPGTLAPLVEAASRDARIGIVGSTIYDPSQRDRLVTAGLHLDWGTGAVKLNKQAAGSDGLVEADLIAACSLLVRTALCRDIGLWDERYWVYWGDTDWCQRALRRGYRVCGHMRSRAWHRDWANTLRSFQGPSALYDELRGALLFNVRHAPRGSLSGVRHLILKSYAKAALEHLTTRQYFGQAAEAAVDDFLHGRFERRRYDPGYRAQQPVPLEQMCERLSRELPDKPTIVLAEMGDPRLAQRIRDAFTAHKPGICWREIAHRPRPRRQDFSTDYAGFLRHDLPRLVGCLLRPRPDLVVADVAVPHLYTLAAGKRVLLLEGHAKAIVLHNRLGRGLFGVVATLLRGVRVAYGGLAHALRTSPALQAAVSGGPRQT